MNTPYRSDCPRCAELARDVDRLTADTKRERRGILVGASKFLGAFCGSMALATVAGFVAHAAIVAPPEPLGPCRDSTEILSQNSSMKACHPGAKASVEVLPRQQDELVRVLLRCACPRSEDGGVP